MDFLRLYGRVLAALGPERRLGALLAFANVLLAVALFAEMRRENDCARIDALLNPLQAAS